MLTEILFTGQDRNLEIVFAWSYGTIIFPGNIGAIRIVSFVKIDQNLIIKNIIECQVNVAPRSIGFFARSTVCEGQEQMVPEFFHRH